MAMVVVEHGDTVYPLDECWESPKFVVAVDETMHLEIQKSEIKKSLSNIRANGFGIEPPGFDLGISPDKT